MSSWEYKRWVTWSCLVATIAFIFMNPQSGHAQQICGVEYTVRSGDSLSRVAGAVYDDTAKWTVIYGGNIAVIGEDPNLIQVGQILRIPCLDGAKPQTSTVEPAAAPIAVSRDGTHIRLLTGDDYAPFTDRKLINDGLITELVCAALNQKVGTEGFSIDWVNDWAAHLDPLLTDRAYDVGFPWMQPDCAGTPDRYRCQNFVFSEPMFEMLVLLFTRTDEPFVFESDADIEGIRLCRPEGYFTHDLDKNGRNWVREGKIELVQPRDVDDCFVLLRDGEVDAVGLNEFTGRSAIHRLGLEDVVAPLRRRPLSIEGLHLLVHKTHPMAQELVTQVNAAIAEIRENGAYDRIVDRHMGAFWAQLDTQ